MTGEERVATAILLALWRAGGRVVSLEAMERETRSGMPALMGALELLARRGCLVERSPAGAELISVGFACWREVLEEESRRAGARIGRRVETLVQTASTNDIAWQAAAEEGNDGLVVLADEQTAGRGRRGHSWHARAGQSVLLSILLAGIEAEALDRLTLLAGLAAAEGIEQAAAESVREGNGVRVEIRWPNDLQVGERKLGGILVEGRRAGSGRAAVVGIGINVAQGPGDYGPEVGGVAGRAVSVFQAAGVLVDRVRVAARVLGALDRRLKDAMHGDGWIDGWKARCGLLGKRIAARDGERRVDGTVVDIDPLQGLIVRDDGGGTQFLSARTSTLSRG